VLTNYTNAPQRVRIIGIVRVRRKETPGIPPTAVGGSFRSDLQPSEKNQLHAPRVELKYYGSGSFAARGSFGIAASKLGLNNPPTAVGGICVDDHKG
jgi:hypothetical protein